MNPAVSLTFQGIGKTKKRGSINFLFSHWLCIQTKVRKNIRNNTLILHNIKKYQTISKNPPPQTFKILNTLKSYIYIDPLYLLQLVL